MNVSLMSAGEAQMGYSVNAVETEALTGRAQRLDELMGRWRKQVMKRKGLLSTVSILPLAACSDPKTLTIGNPTDDISARTDLSGFSLDLQNATTELTMTLEQHNDVSFINTAGTQTVVLTTAGTTSTKPGIENYEILEGTTLAISSSTDGVNVTETGTNGTVSTIDVSGRTLTGNFVDFDATDILKVTQSANISGAAGAAGSDPLVAGSALGFGVLDFADSDGVTVTMTIAQHDAMTMTGTDNAQTIKLSNAGTVATKPGIENYEILEGTTLTIASNAVNVTESDDGDDTTPDVNSTLIVGGRTLTGTYTGFDAGDVLEVTTTADISGANSGGVLGLGVVDFKDTDGVTLTMSVAQHGAMALTNTDGTQTVTLSDAGAIFGKQGIENYELSDAGNTILVNTNQTDVNITGGTAADIVDVGGFTVDGTYTGLGVDDTIVALPGADISGVNGGNATGAGILIVNNSAGTFTMTQAQHQGLATVNNTDGVQTFALTTAGVLTAREGIENYTLHNGAGNVISVLAATNVNANAASADVINVGGLTVTGTYQTGTEDTISATAGANISGAAIGSVDALDINNSAGTYTMTQAQHEQLATVSYTNNAQTFVLTSAGTITARLGIENYHLADAGGSTFTQIADPNTPKTAVSVKSGSGNDLIITSAVDENRDVLTIDLTSGGNDTVRILNDSGSVTPHINVIQFGALTAGQTLIINGLTYTAGGSGATATEVASFFASKSFGTTHTS
ncbi:MAG: hypothetical protein VKK05_02200, partial [Synechococcus sp.]|nr:hypothetical protein [Synechococcus sp.]